MKTENRFYTAKEVLNIIKGGWKREPEEVKELVEFVDSVKMTKFERKKIIGCDEVNLLYSMYDQLF